MGVGERTFHQPTEKYPLARPNYQGNKEGGYATGSLFQVSNLYLSTPTQLKMSATLNMKLIALQESTSDMQYHRAGNIDN